MVSHFDFVWAIHWAKKPFRSHLTCEGSPSLSFSFFCFHAERKKKWNKSSERNRKLCKVIAFTWSVVSYNFFFGGRAVSVTNQLSAARDKNPQAKRVSFLHSVSSSSSFFKYYFVLFNIFQLGRVLCSVNRAIKNYQRLRPLKRSWMRPINNLLTSFW